MEFVKKFYSNLGYIKEEENILDAFSKILKSLTEMPYA